MKKGAEQVERIIGQDLICPSCEYNLRGLRGERVVCPECGVEHDVAGLVTRKWVGPWHKAPGLTRVLMPVAFATIGAPLVILVTAIVFYPLLGELTVLGGLLAAGSIWGFMLFRLGGFMPQGRAVELSLLGHGIFVGYLASIVVGATLSILAFTSEEPVLRLMAFPIIGAAIGAIWLCRRGEKFIAEQCIRHYLASGRGGGPVGFDDATEAKDVTNPLPTED